MPGSDYGVIPYEVDEITAFLETWLNDNLRGYVDDAFSVSFDSLVKYWKWIASDSLLKSDDAEVGDSGTAYVKKKTITFDPTPAEAVKTSEFRIKFDLRTENSDHTAYGKIYKNGVAVGTEQSTNSQTYVTKSEDIGDWEADDTIELWIKTSQAGITVLAKNFRLYADFESILYTEPIWS